jgi:hypothetical protein
MRKIESGPTGPAGARRSRASAARACRVRERAVLLSGPDEWSAIEVSMCQLT